MTDLRSAAVPPRHPDDHARGDGRPVIFYGDLACPRCALAWDRLAGAQVELVFRHFALKTKHPRALALAHAAEAAAAQRGLWEFLDGVYRDQGHVDDPHLWAHAERLGLDVERFEADRRGEAARDRVQRDVREALRAGVTATPTLVVDGVLHAGPPDPELVLGWSAIGSTREEHDLRPSGPTHGRAKGTTQ